MSAAFCIMGTSWPTCLTIGKLGRSWAVKSACSESNCTTPCMSAEKADYYFGFSYDQNGGGPQCWDIEAGEYKVIDSYGETLTTAPVRACPSYDPRLGWLYHASLRGCAALNKLMRMPNCAPAWRSQSPLTIVTQRQEVKLRWAGEPAREV